MNLAKMIVRGAAAGALTALTVHQLARAAERDHPPKGRFVESGGVRLHVLERGTGEPILYIHGNGGMIAEVEATGLIDSFSAGHHVIVPDRPVGTARAREQSTGRQSGRRKRLGP